MSGLSVLPGGANAAAPFGPSPFLVGLDLGQRRDYTALAVLERTPPPPARPAAYDVRQLDRVRQSSYPAIVAGVAALLRTPPLAGALLVVDETGVGAAPCDLLAAAGLAPLRATITAGSVVHRDGDRATIPKRDLVGTVAVLLESGRLRVAEALPMARELIGELHNFRARISPAGHDAYGAGDDWRDGNHDDLVLAVALAAWAGEQAEDRSATSYSYIGEDAEDDDHHGGPGAWFGRGAW